MDPNHVLRRKVTNAFDSVLCCPSKLFSGGGISPDNLMQMISQYKNSEDSLRNVLNALVDGGNTENLVTTIATSNPLQTSELQQTLLNNSPYLSDTVMKQAINKETVLPNEIIRDVLVANPQAAKTNNVLNELNNRTIPMPDTMMSDILNGRDTVSPKEDLEASLYSVKLSRQYYFNELLRYYQQDTLNPSASHDSLISLLINEKSLTAQYLLAFVYLYDRNLSNVNTILENIPHFFNLSKEQTRQYQDYLTYFTFLSNLTNQGRNTNQLTPDEYDQINEIMINVSEPVKSFARDILEANGLLTFHEPILVPKESTKSAKDGKYLKTGSFHNDLYMKVFPNPAKQYVIVEYNLKDVFNKSSTSVFTIHNVNGILIESKMLQRSCDQFIINTTNFIPGEYICTIDTGKKHVCQRKVVIIQ